MYTFIPALTAYPASLKRRIAGEYGNLLSDSAREILSAMNQARLRWVVLSHVRSHNNLPEVTYPAFCGGRSSDPMGVAIAWPEENFSWIEV